MFILLCNTILYYIFEKSKVILTIIPLACFSHCFTIQKINPFFKFKLKVLSKNLIVSQKRKKVGYSVVVFVFCFILIIYCNILSYLYLKKYKKYCNAEFSNVSPHNTPFYYIFPLG